jgi:hypothetical protein
MVTSYSNKTEKLTPSIGRELRAKSRPLTNTEMFQAAPSLFQAQAHDSRSSRFKPISTIDVVDALRSEGFEPFSVLQSRARDESKIDFTRHQVRFRKREELEGELLLPEWNEIILVNANDGTSSYQVMAGGFRQACANGLVLGDINRTQRVHHKGANIEKDVIEGVYSVVNQFKEIDEFKEDMQRTMLSVEDRNGLAMAALIFAGYDYQDLPYDHKLLLKTHRHADSGHDLWSTFNVVQENLVKGGVKYKKFDEDKQTVRNVSTKGITSIQKNIQVNQGVWTAAKMLINSTQEKQDVLALV